MSEERREIFVGIDLHKRTWHVTVRDADVELIQWEHTWPVGVIVEAIAAV